MKTAPAGLSVDKDYSALAQRVDSVADTIWDMASKVWTFGELGFEERASVR
jgi:hypothetical protein